MSLIMEIVKKMKFKGFELDSPMYGIVIDGLADLVLRGYGGYNTRWVLFLFHHLYPLVRAPWAHHLRMLAVCLMRRTKLGVGALLDSRSYSVAQQSYCFFLEDFAE
ncbi:hypothetical protein U1Q18_035466 [Sarracenia purpurea var. burkii]